jgi:hypothetical protein
MARFDHTAKSARSEDEPPKLESLLARTRKSVQRQATSSTKALRAAALRRAVSLAKSATCSLTCGFAHTAESKAQHLAAAPLLAQRVPCIPNLVYKSHMAACPARDPRPNQSLNRSANGVPPGPRRCCGSSSASRPRHHTAVARLALR